MEKGFLLIVLNIATLVSAQNECSLHNNLGDLAKRSPTFFMDAVPICDRYIVKDWYVAVNHEMPTTAPGLGSCGTLYPIWLHDTLPGIQEKRKPVTLCHVGFDSQCSRNSSIRVTNCGTFFVYELTPLDICQSAYCFEKTETCINSVPSNVAVEYHGVTWTSNPPDWDNNTLNVIHDPDVNLVCKFDRLPDQSIFYDVTWYVDNTEVLRNQTVSSNSSDLALLTGSQIFSKGKKANSMVHCIVGAKISATDAPCNTSSSPLFFAGIKVLTPTLRVTRGGHQNVKIQFTIPFVNQHAVSRTPYWDIEGHDPLLINMGVHGGSAFCDDPNKRACETKVYGYKRHESDKYNTDDWKSIHSIAVYNKDDGDFTPIDKHITLRFETGVTSGTGSRIFDNIILPDIQVFIEDPESSWKGAYCESHTDPHMKTFDRKYYECQLDGTFILYRNSHFKQEVQEKHHMCHRDYPYPRCSCAVAVRSGRDVFMVDICNSKSIIHFPSCGDRVLKVIKKNDRYYKVILPTGTLVEIKFVSWPSHNDWQLNVDIFPSPSDVGNSSGLCGILDGDYTNDFTRNDPAGTVDNPHLTYPNDFSESWRVKGNELDLFDHNSYGNLDSISEVLDRVCTCKKNDLNPHTGDIECTYGTYKHCKFVVGKPFHCILNPEGQLRRKRDLRHLKLMLLDAQTENKPDKRQKREVVLSVKTYEEAEAICNTAFQASKSYQTCQEYVTNLSNTSLINCISDIMMTGDDNFTQIHIEAALEQCSVFVVLNITFQEAEPEVTYTIETFCQNNCSRHGICNAGNCTCHEGYAGSDCSFDLLGPPTISHISDFGFCDKSKEPCDEITLFGKYFVENMYTNCLMTRHTLKEDGSFVSMAEYVVGLEERTLFEGFCPLDYDTSTHWVTEFSLNISNDGSRFTENFHVYTYQSLCQEYRNDTGNITFVFKDGYCFINNLCVADGSTNTHNKCDICNTTRSKYEWSYNEGHCYISGVCYKSGEFNGTDPCSICDPSEDSTTWSPNTDLCFIDKTCYNDGQTQSDKNCNVCKPNISRTKWTIKNGCVSTTGIEPTTLEPTTATTTVTITTTTSEPPITTTMVPSTTPKPTTKTTESRTTTPETTTTTPEPTTTSPEPTTTTPEPTTTTTTEPTTTPTHEPTTTSPEPTTTSPEPTTTSPEPTTTTIEPTTITPEPTTTTTPEPTTLTPEPTTTIPKPTTTITPEPTTITPGSTTTTTQEPTTTTPDPTTLTPDPTTTTAEPTTTTPKITTTTLEPTPSTTEPTTTIKIDHSTTPKRSTTTPEHITTTPEPSTTTQKPTTTTPKHITTTAQPTTTTQEPTSTTSEPITTTPELTTKTTIELSTSKAEQTPSTTTLEPTNSTPEPTNTTLETSTTTPASTTAIHEATSTTPEPTSTTLEATTTIPEPTTSTTKEPTYSTTEPTTTTSEPKTLTPGPSTTTPESTTTTQNPFISTQSNCIKSPEDVSVVFHSVSWISTNETNGTTIRTVHEPYINFKCMFNTQHDMPVFYKVEWYVNNVTLIKTVIVSVADIDQATLSSKDLPPLDHTSGIQIHCTVIVLKDPASEMCKRSPSPFFFAGIKVNETYHNLLRKGKTAIMLNMTIPYVTKSVVVNGQPQPLPTLAVYSRFDPSTSRSKGSIGVDKCVIEFKAFSFNERHKYDSNDWRQNQTLVLYHVDTDGYAIDHSLTVQLKTRTNNNVFWNNFNQTISMTIADHNEYWKGKSCGSKTDPHMYTFDRVSYENHINGEFILYRNRLFNQEVQTRHKQCHPDYNFPHCTCAVSVQSGQDVFLVDLCGDFQFVDFLSCNDGVIQVYKLRDKLYKIYLPTGTYVMVSLVEWPVQGSWQIDIDIYPSLTDVNNTEGLCGTLDGDRDNDFKRRNGDTDSVNLLFPDGFSNSWKLLNDENLLLEPLSTRQPISSHLDKICLCSPNGDECSYNMHCSTTVKKKFLCTESTIQTSGFRKKRDIFQEWRPSNLAVAKPLIRKRRNVQFNISTSRENADAVCTSAFESSEPYKICQEYVSDLSNAALSNCINDVIMTGDNNITAIHVDAALQQCVTFVGLNLTLKNANFAVTTSLQNLCPSNCSGHGVCKEGSCSCEAGLGGSDCSFDILSPPIIWESTPNGTCDKSLRQCSRVHFKGRYFLENVEKNCYITKQSIQNDGSVLAVTKLERPLEEENLFRGTCSLTSDDSNSWVTKYLVNVSYDRKQFSQTLSFYTFQSKCQQHSVENGNDEFTLKEGYCFIDNVCVQRAYTNPDNRCKVCDPGKNNFKWSEKQGCESTIKPPESSVTTLVYIVTASVLSFLFVFAIVVIIGVWRYQRSKKSAESSADENTDYRRDVVGKTWMRFFDDGKFPYIPRGSRYTTQTYKSKN